MILCTVSMCFELILVHLQCVISSASNTINYELASLHTDCESIHFVRIIVVLEPGTFYVRKVPSIQYPSF